MPKSVVGAFLSALLTIAGGAAAQDAQGEQEEWRAPFGGTFSANFTLASEYNYAGISNTMGQPAYQFGVGYNTPRFGEAVPVWLHLHGWTSNVRYPSVNEAFEVDLGASIKTLLIDGRLKLDLGYTRYFYPGTPIELGYEYGELGFSAEYDFGPFYVNARIRHSPDFFGRSGASWNKRVRLGVPLDFLPLPKSISMMAYGSLGNFWVENFILDGLPGNEYSYWQFGLTAMALGLEFHVAYIGTTISYEGCNYTNYCSDRVFFSVTKSFLSSPFPLLH